MQPVSRPPTQSVAEYLTQIKDIMIHFTTLKKTFSQLLPSVDISSCLNSLLQINLSSLIKLLKSNYSMNIDGHKISYKLTHQNLTLRLGTDPINSDYTIRHQQHSKQKLLELTVQEVINSDITKPYLHRLTEERVNEYTIQERLENSSHKGEEQEEDSEEEEGKKDRKRMNQRPIGFVIDKVREWRELYSNRELGLKLEEAAKKVGISKKSLDDYVLQLRKGFQYGFNFNQHRHDKIGVLRDYNRRKDNEIKFKGKDPKEKVGQRKPKKVPRRNNKDSDDDSDQ